VHDADIGTGGSGIFGDLSKADKSQVKNTSIVAAMESNDSCEHCSPLPSFSFRDFDQQQAFHSLPHLVP
jgi:hypothetical protein